MGHIVIGHEVLVYNNSQRGFNEIYVVLDTSCKERKSVVCFLYYYSCT